MEFNRNRKIAETCPCGKSNRNGKFSPLTNNPKAGKCFACGKFFAPAKAWKPFNYLKIINTQPPSALPLKYLKASMYHGSNNNLKQYLLTKFNKQQVDEVFNLYYCGSLETIKGSTVFWQITATGVLRAGKIMLYNQKTGHRCKDAMHGVSTIGWVHKYYKLQGFNLHQCFFGEHLLVDSQKPVVIVESEKTALVCALTLPEFTWLATGSITGLQNKNYNVLRNREVTLAPDVGAFNLWKSYCAEINSRYGMNITVSSMLEDMANDTEKELKIDVADKILERQSWN